MGPVPEAPHWQPTIPPFYALATFDAFADRLHNSIETHEQDTKSTVSVRLLDGSHESTTSLFKLGRPLWGAFLENGMSLNDVISLAQTKLSNMPPFAAMDPSASSALLWLSLRITFNLTHHSFAEYFVSHGMRFLIYVNESRDIICTAQPSEPILAFVAACQLQSSANRVRALRAFLSTFLVGAVSTGDIGEIVAGLICLFSIDSIQYSPEAPVGVQLPSYKSVKSFVGSLWGSSANTAVESVMDQRASARLYDFYRGGKIFFNHITRVPSFPTSRTAKTTLANALNRGTAIFCPLDFPGADLLIPVLMPQGVISCIMIQVKNTKDDYMRHCQAAASPAFARAASLIFGQTSQPPFMAIYMSLRCRAKQAPEFQIIDTTSDASDPTPMENLITVALGVDGNLYPNLFPEQHRRGQDAAYEAERDGFYSSLTELRDAQAQASFQGHPNRQYLASLQDYLH